MVTADLQNVIQSRNDVPHDDQHAKDRWRQELEARTVPPPAIASPQYCDTLSRPT